MAVPLLLIATVQLMCANFISGNETTEYTTTNGNEDLKLSENGTSGKHESLLNCPSFDLNEDDYVLFPNGTAFVEAYNKTYNESFYILRNGVLTICVPDFFEEDIDISREYLDNLSILTQIGLGISMVCLLLHLVVFCLVSELRNLPGYNLASLCLSLLLGYVFFIIANSTKVRELKPFCTAAATITHFFLLSSFVWMSIMAFDVYKSLLHATGSLRVTSAHFKLKKFTFYSLLAWGIALCFAAAALITDNVEGVPDIYRPFFEKSCWFEHRKALLVFFAGPVFAMICSNFTFFGLSAYTIFHNRMKKDQDSQRSVLKKNYLMYFRLAVIMGVTWITGVLAPVVNSEWLWYLFAILNTLQGLFIFLAFTCSGKVKKYFRSKLGARRPSEQTLSPTFQSYCFYANSIEKDLNKVVDTNKDKSDTIMIHL
ncbi:G-protein coupled receptor Mth2-like [Uloborus diversus]|uniref:G-protein coupled receptor Mth2-like n=1 Tax=Uloborus diversus TaxID=327109 RepID=UPI00240A32C7|nr:G-protein coupled receptor Mth2-like [Uloborus diversus]